MANTSLVYPAPAVQDAALTYVKAVVPVGAATTVNVFTTALGMGRFFVTALVIHDPQAAVAGAVGSVALAFGSASTATTSLSQGVVSLIKMDASTANQFLQLAPGLINGTTRGDTTAVTYNAAGFAPAFALGGGDCIQANVTAATAQNTATTSTVQVDIVGYYI